MSNSETKICKNSRTTSVYYSGEPAQEYRCEVKISPETIIVEYDDAGETVQYQGNNTGDGHFHLVCPDRKGSASLHMFPNSTLLVGCWVQEGIKGMWRIQLA